MIGGTANTLQECETLIGKEVAYISLGPFSESTTKDISSPVLGVTGYAAIIDILNTKTPILGVGGITLKDVPDLLKSGISGIAVSEEITRNFDSIKTFNQLLNASSTEEKRHTFTK